MQDIKIWLLGLFPPPVNSLCLLDGPIDRSRIVYSIRVTALKQEDGVHRAGHQRTHLVRISALAKVMPRSKRAEPLLAPSSSSMRPASAEASSSAVAGQSCRPPTAWSHKNASAASFNAAENLLGQMIFSRAGEHVALSNVGIARPSQNSQRGLLVLPAWSEFRDYQY